MNVKEKYNLEKEKPYKVVCLNGDYSASFADRKDAVKAKNKHQKKYGTHDVKIKKTVYI